ncbi:MAG: hypothetical protein HYX32_07640 [Actinobacteria bacterium]|nr:hypothetical protein [Actinomycetota bacterium]
MGFDMTVGELAERYKYWWYLGHLLGIDPRLVHDLKNNEEAGRVDDMRAAVTAPPEPVSVTLVAATRDKAIANYPNDLAELPERTTFTAVAAAPITDTE